MGSAEEFRNRGRCIARRFLQTAVVVDDEAFMAPGSGPATEVVVPSRRTQTLRQNEPSPTDRRSTHTLDARSITDSFSRLGIICGVVGPMDSTMETMRQADIVILDWLLQDGEPKHTLRLLRDLLDERVDSNSLRLIAIYTGEARLEEICADVFTELQEAELAPSEREDSTEIAYRHGRVVLYAKSDVNLASRLKGRSVAEDDLPKRLVEDFASMTEGLLPGIALASLTAVREGAHKVLDQFSAKLDPAFLAHRASLPNPEDAERQFVNHVAEELRGLMDNGVAEESPAGTDAVEGWIGCKQGESGSFKFGNKELDLEQTIILATEGLTASKLKKNTLHSSGWESNVIRPVGCFANSSR